MDEEGDFAIGRFGVTSSSGSSGIFDDDGVEGTKDEDDDEDEDEDEEQPQHVHEATLPILRMLLLLHSEGHEDVPRQHPFEPMVHEDEDEGPEDEAQCEHVHEATLPTRLML